MQSSVFPYRNQSINERCQTGVVAMNEGLGSGGAECSSAQTGQADSG